MNTNSFCITISFLLVLSASYCYRLGLCEEEEEGLLRMATNTMMGGVKDCKEFENSLEIQSLARFAVQEHNKNQNALLEFARVLKAKEQVVAGGMYYLTVEAIDAGKKKIYEAKVWVKPWINFKQLQEFKYAQDAPSFTISDLGVKQDGHGLGWQEVATHDPVVIEAADHAVKTIQQRSNSLFPYQLLQILVAKAEVIEEFVKLDLVLRVKRGSTEEKLKVEVHRNNKGTFHLNHMVPQEAAT